MPYNATENCHWNSYRLLLHSLHSVAAAVVTAAATVIATLSASSSSDTGSTTLSLPPLQLLQLLIKLTPPPLFTVNHIQPPIKYNTATANSRCAATTFDNALVITSATTTTTATSYVPATVPILRRYFVCYATSSTVTVFLWSSPSPRTPPLLLPLLLQLPPYNSNFHCYVVNAAAFNSLKNLQLSLICCAKLQSNIFC